MDLMNDIKKFNDKFGIEIAKSPKLLPDSQMETRLEFQLEELLETAHAAGFYFDSKGMSFKRMSKTISPNMPEILDGLIDQIYVALGTVSMLGFFAEKPGYWSRFEEAWERVHEANMKKVRMEGFEKIQKPDGWERPNLEDLCK